MRLIRLQNEPTPKQFIRHVLYEYKKGEITEHLTLRTERYLDNNKGLTSEYILKRAIQYALC